MKKKSIIALFLVVCVVLSLFPAVNVLAAPTCKYLSDFTDEAMPRKNVGWGTYTKDLNLDGKPISLSVEGVTIEFKKGVLAHAKSDLIYDLGAGHNYDFFSAYLGIDKSQPRGKVKFTVSVSGDMEKWTDLYKTGEILGTGQAEYIKVPVTGSRYLRIFIDDNGGNGNDHSALADAYVYSKDYNLKGQDIVKPQSYYEERLKTKVDSIKSGKMKNEDELLLLQYNLVNNARYVALNYFLTGDNAAENQKFMSWFFNNRDMMKLYAEAGSPIGGNYINSLTVLSKLYNQYKGVLNDKTPLKTTKGTRGELYTKMMMAISMTHADRVINWMDGKTGSDPVKRFEVYKDLYEKNLLYNEVFESLEVEEMRWVVNNMMYDYEIAWANNYARTHPRSDSEKDKSFPMIYSPHHHIKYTGGYDYSKGIYRDPAKYDSWNAKYKLKEYGLPYEAGTNLMWHLFEEGSVCGGIAKTGANLAQSFGVPAAVIGQPGHAAFLVYSLDKDGKGIWGIDNNVSGWAGSEKSERMPLDWGNAKDSYTSYYQVSYVGLSQAALNDYENYKKAEEILMLASLNLDFKTKESVYKAALSVMPYHLDAWVGLFDLYIKNNADSKTLYETVAKITRDLEKYPVAMKDVSKILTEVLSQRVKADKSAQSYLLKANAQVTASLNRAKNVKEGVNVDITKVMANALL